MKVMFTIEVDFDPEVTDSESLANAFDGLLCDAFDDLVNDHGDLVIYGFESLETPKDFEEISEG